MDRRRQTGKLSARTAAYQALLRINQDGAYANLVVPPLVSEVAEYDRGLATELAYGTTRMQRACDFAVDRFLVKPPAVDLRCLLRLGAYQLLFTRVATHAAVSETVSLAPKGLRPVVNAVLRRVAASGEPVWPDEPTRLSYPDWIVARLTAELGANDAAAALTRMNVAPAVTIRGDGYIQDRSSMWVADLVEAQPGDRVLDMCAAPGGKATHIAASGAHVIAADLQHHRAGLIAANVERLGCAVPVITADGRSAPFADATFDRVLLDAPCSGLGALRRRPDARWRITAGDIDHLANLQRSLLAEARRLVRPGGVLVYSACTLTAAESIDHVLEWPTLPVPAPPWRPYGRGARILPHDADTDGMTILRWRRPG